MAKRPHFNKSIEELEGLFLGGKSDKAILAALMGELKHRKTKRAGKLKDLVASELNVLSAPGDLGGVSTPQKPAGTKVPTPEKETPVASAPLGNSQVVIRPPRPEVTNAPENVLGAWTALEVLSPLGYRRPADLAAGESGRIASLDGRLLPWESNEKSRPGKRLYYEVILGSINLGPAIEMILNVYSDSRPDAPYSNRRAALASVLVDKNGRPLDEESSVAISSFAWGVPIALNGDLKDLASWPKAEWALRSSFDKKLIKRENDGDIAPLTGRTIRDLYEHLIGILRLSELDVSPPEFAIRRFEFFASRIPPEPSLLNSFFLEDLALARNLLDSGKAPQALQFYLGMQSPTERTDLLDDQAGLLRLVDPEKTPLGSWPGPGRFPLAILQQAAVNATSLAPDPAPLLAVNGPPGTGKTTLLRDVVAARIVERAEVMASFEDPCDAFAPTSETFQRRGATVTLHRLVDRLKGFEMVVASSNNKAVENVSAELPSLGAIAEDATTLRYLPSIASNSLGREAWGAISAVLGNASNRYEFSQQFWRDEENGLSTYLNHAAGIPQIVPEFGEGRGGQTRLRHVVEEEQAPENKRDALRRWRAARSEFESAIERARAVRRELQRLHLDVERAREIEEECSGIRQETSECEVAIRDLLPKKAEMARVLDELSAAQRVHKAKVIEHRQVRPGLFARFLRLKRAREWSAAHRLMVFSCKEAESAEGEAAGLLSNLENGLTEIEVRSADLREREAAFMNELLPLRLTISEAKLSGVRTIPDGEFFDQSDAAIQVSSLWFSEVENAERGLVFEKAIALHRAFLDGAADAIRQNLAIFTESFGTRSLGTTSKDNLIPDLWSTFFLVVPVVSTTFASVHKMFSRLPPESIGWLMVDEAGQALPQAAVGALIRAKRAVVVGDPLQIEPVVTLPNTLTEEICGHLGLDALRFNAPEASVQTLADSASPYCARLPIGSGHRDIGAPLLVHRRCDSPMFEISNAIAYANLMVQAKKPGSGLLPCGPSRWIDVQGDSGPDKWCEDEARVLIELLEVMRSKGHQPDFYVVTPFVILQDTLRKRLVGSSVMQGWVDRPEAWVREHVGTVHTVQGREAETVFFVLGAQSPSQNGARQWAGSRPNLVNVAVTRAKSALYVIGNVRLWRNAGVFSTLGRFVG